jgi:hypothetical protein
MSLFRTAYPESYAYFRAALEGTIALSEAPVRYLNGVVVILGHDDQSHGTSN